MDDKKKLVVLVFAFALSFFYFNKKSEPPAQFQPPQQQQRWPQQPQQPQPQQPRLPQISEVRPLHRDYNAMVAVLKTWESEAEDFVEVGTYGKTSRGQDQYYIKITNEFNQAEKPRSLMTGCIHGNEPISTWTTMWWIGRILSTYGQNPEVTELVDTRELYFIPVVCPDSYPSSRHCDGLDPNRNFPSGNSDNRSIPPIQNLKEFFKRMQFDCYASGHSYGRIWLFASNSDPQRKAVYSRIEKEIGRLSSYRISSLGGPGTTLDADWGNRQGAFSTIIEFGTHQRAPSERDIETEFEATYEAALYFMKEASVAFSIGRESCA